MSPSESLVPTQKPVYIAMASASELLLPAVTTFYLKKTQDGMEGQASHTLMSRLRDSPASTASSLALDGLCHMKVQDKTAQNLLEWGLIQVL